MRASLTRHTTFVVVLVAGMTVHYRVVLPAGYDATQAYPGIIALG